MKINLEIDCTPLEARLFFGLPDVQPLQTAMMAEMENTMIREARRFSPEALMQFWFSSMPQGAEWVRTMMSTMLNQGTTTTSTPKDD
ncbi:hypothetical protein RHAL1_03218 [Beijerinckiaceae bacterium RH AL1]|nr:DUF6489 family protein [Beijerinckiaceae bacterium]VVB48234.1 hypothetical protein RHCH11_RHCH11_03153 [Beijerinckiaceae bacterium RH CH11]VVB48314.1 hypothetical protein RHAL8_03149 [Beijerinckiaceae bacterium RH AL8]VVC56291.1 hypothetical protein RHAL1_03218 [Beijerinckiaceae bacterium RH AL1]